MRLLQDFPFTQRTGGFWPNSWRLAKTRKRKQRTLATLRARCRRAQVVLVVPTPDPYGMLGLLPTELRLQVFGKLLPERLTVAHSNGYGAEKVPALLRVSRGIKAEFEDVMYSTMPFCYDLTDRQHRTTPLNRHRAKMFDATRMNQVMIKLALGAYPQKVTHMRGFNVLSSFLTDLLHPFSTTGVKRKTCTIILYNDQRPRLTPVGEFVPHGDVDSFHVGLKQFFSSPMFNLLGRFQGFETVSIRHVIAQLDAAGHHPAWVARNKDKFEYLTSQPGWNHQLRVHDRFKQHLEGSFGRPKDEWFPGNSMVRPGKEIDGETTRWLLKFNPPGTGTSCGGKSNEMMLEEQKAATKARNELYRARTFKKAPRMPKQKADQTETIEESESSESEEPESQTKQTIESKVTVSKTNSETKEASTTSQHDVSTPAQKRKRGSSRKLTENQNDIPAPNKKRGRGRPKKMT